MLFLAVALLVLSASEAHQVLKRQSATYTTDGEDTSVYQGQSYVYSPTPAPNYNTLQAPSGYQQEAPTASSQSQGQQQDTGYSAPTSTNQGYSAQNNANVGYSQPSSGASYSAPKAQTTQQQTNVYQAYQSSPGVYQQPQVAYQQPQNSYQAPQVYYQPAYQSPQNSYAVPVQAQNGYQQTGYFQPAQQQVVYPNNPLYCTSPFCVNQGYLQHEGYVPVYSTAMKVSECPKCREEAKKRIESVVRTPEVPVYNTYQAAPNTAPANFGAGNSDLMAVVKKEPVGYVKHKADDPNIPVGYVKVDTECKSSRCKSKKKNSDSSDSSSSD